MNQQYGFKRNQLLSICTVIILAPALRLFPSGPAELAGSAAWLSSAAALPPLLFYVYFLSRFMAPRQDGDGLAELFLTYLGDKAGRVILILLSVWLAVYGGFVLRSGAERFVTTIYPNSSPAFFSIIMGVLGAIAAFGSLRSLARIAKIVLPVVIGVLLLVLVSALFSVDAGNLLPLTWRNTIPVIKASSAAVNVIATTLFLSCFAARMTPNMPGKEKDFSLWVIFMCALLCFIGLDVIGSFGADLTASLTQPFFSLVRNLVFFHSVERVEALVVTLWVFPDFLLISLLMHSSQHCFRRALGQDPAYCGEKLSDMSNRRWLILLCALISIVCSVLIAPDARSLELWSEKIVPAINLAVTFILVPLVFLTGKLRKAV